VRSSVWLSFAFAACAACGGSSKSATAYPERKPGCEVSIYRDAPTVQTDNIGTVTATCDGDLSDDDCLRELKDQACKLGGDVLWGVPASPTLAAGKKKLSGRAAHTVVDAPRSGY
jgi:hypothetical protein